MRQLQDDVMVPAKEGEGFILNIEGLESVALFVESTNERDKGNAHFSVHHSYDKGLDGANFHTPQGKPYVYAKSGPYILQRCDGGLWPTFIKMRGPIRNGVLVTEGRDQFSFRVYGNPPGVNPTEPKPQGDGTRVEITNCKVDGFFDLDRFDSVVLQDTAFKVGTWEELDKLVGKKNVTMSGCTFALDEYEGKEVDEEEANKEFEGFVKDLIDEHLEESRRRLDVLEGNGEKMDDDGDEQGDVVRTPLQETKLMLATRKVVWVIVMALASYISWVIWSLIL